MSNQENGNVKQMKLRIPMELFRQLQKDAAEHKEEPSTRARHILMDALMNIPLTDEDRRIVKKMVDENWKKIRKE